jgi:hypothetical protein
LDQQRAAQHHRLDQAEGGQRSVLVPHRRKIEVSTTSARTNPAKGAIAFR